MTTSDVVQLRKEIVEIKEVVDALSKSVSEFHEKVDEKNKQQDATMARIEQSLQFWDVLGDKINKALKPILSIIGLIGFLWAFIKFVVIAAITSK